MDGAYDSTDFEFRSDFRVEIRFRNPSCRRSSTVGNDLVIYNYCVSFQMRVYFTVSLYDLRETGCEMIKMNHWK